MNKVTLIGRLGADPIGRDFVSKRTGKEECMATLSIGVSEGYGANKHLEWVSCIAYGKVAKNASMYLSKGSLVGITGRLKKSCYKSKDGYNVWRTDVIVSEMEFLGGKNAEKVPLPEEPTAEEIPEDVSEAPPTPDEGFMDIPDSNNLIQDLPFR